MSPSDQSPTDRDSDDIIPDRSEALEFEPVVRSRPKRRFGMVLTLLVLAAGSAGAGWYYYGDSLLADGDGEIPVIRAVEGPVKVRPDNPGGMAIPDRDKLVYERLRGSEDELRVERLLPLPELPLAPPAPEAETPIPAAPAPVEKQLAEPIINPESIPKIDDAAKITPPLPPSATQSAPSAPSSAPPPPPPPNAPGAIADPAMVYRIQLAAVRSEEAATSEWMRLKKNNADLFDALTLNVIKVDLGADKGIFYRLRAGPLATEEAAKKLCEQLSGRKIGCLIVRPGG